MVERLFLAVPRGSLQFVIVVFPDYTHYFSRDQMLQTELLCPVEFYVINAPSTIDLLLTIPRRCFFCESFLLCFVFVMLSCLFIAALWSPAGKELTSWLSYV